MHNDMPRPEEWRTIPSHPDYEVSSYGRVISNKSGRSRVLKPHTHPLGYMRLTVDGRQQSVHRLVAEAWHGPCPEGKEVDHINSVRDDNRPQNLCYLTRQENMARMVPAKSLVTHCPEGHAYEGENLYIRPTGRRGCRECSTQGVRDLRNGSSGVPCTAEGCDRNAYVRIRTDTAVCEMHYQRERRDEKKLRLAQRSDTQRSA